MTLNSISRALTSHIGRNSSGCSNTLGIEMSLFLLYWHGAFHLFIRSQDQRTNAAACGTPWPDLVPSPTLHGTSATTLTVFAMNLGLTRPASSCVKSTPISIWRPATRRLSISLRIDRRLGLV